MWLMMLACAVPILFSTFGSNRTSTTIWVLIGIGLMAFLHWIDHRLSRRQLDKRQSQDKATRADDQLPDTNHNASHHS